jgi:hypothetical protein
MIRQILADSGYSTTDKRLFKVLLLPSGISTLICVLLAVAVGVVVFTSTHFSGSTLEQQVGVWRAINTENDYSYYGGSAALTLDSAFNQVATFIMYALFGIVLYFFAVGLITAFRGAEEFEHELKYANVSSKQLKLAAFVHLGIRVVVVVIWFFYLKFFFGTVLFACLSWLYMAADAIATVNGIGHALLAVCVLSLSLHVHVVLLRLLVLRPRLFQSESYL